MKSKKELKELLKAWDDSEYEDKTTALQLSLTMWQWMKDRIKKTGRPVHKAEWFLRLDRLFPDLELTVPRFECYLCEYTIRTAAPQAWRSVCDSCPVDWKEERKDRVSRCRNGEFGAWCDEMDADQKDPEHLLKAVKSIIVCIKKALKASEGNK